MACMRQTLHLLIVDAAMRTALAAHVGSRWLLPILTCGEHVRADPLAVRWARDRGLECDVVGQWLGRVSKRRMDWLMVLSVAGTRDARHPLLAWTPLDTFRPTSAVDDYQRWAIAASRRRSALPNVAGPFGRFAWTDDVRQWIARHAGTAVSGLDPLRSSPREVVRRARTGRGDVYFKGIARERACEARLTIQLAALAPDRFAETVALDEQQNGSVWWLTAGCPGGPAVLNARIAGLVAAIQRSSEGACSIERELPSLDIDAALAWAAGAVAGEPRVVDSIENALGSVIRSTVPRAWTPLDLHPTNVLMDEDDAVRFIDLDDSFLAPAPLAMAAVVSRAGDRSLYEAYERSWTPRLGDLDWRAFERTAAIIELWLGWRRLLRKAGRGEIAGAVGPAALRVRERLRRLSG